MSLKAEEVMKRALGLDANVDFYSASLYHYLGIPVDIFTPLFAVSRIVGWSAHVMEQYHDNRLIRPRERYVGKMGLPYIPIKERQKVSAS